MKVEERLHKATERSKKKIYSSSSQCPLPTPHYSPTDLDQSLSHLFPRYHEGISSQFKIINKVPSTQTSLYIIIKYKSTTD